MTLKIIDYGQYLGSKIFWSKNNWLTNLRYFKIKVRILALNLFRHCENFSRKLYENNKNFNKWQKIPFINGNKRQ